MRSRLLTLAATLALAVGGAVLISASPAAAAPAHCSGWNTHPDLYNQGDFSFDNGTFIRSGPYTDCPANGQGYPSHGIDVHCFVYNSSGNVWLYLRDTTTGVNGWSRIDALRISGSGSIRNCYS